MRSWLGILAGVAAFSLPACGQDFNLSPTFAGHAYALQVAQLGANPVVLAETGPAPAHRGQRENSLLNTPPLPGVTAQELYAVTLGAGSRNRSQASLAYFHARLGSHYVAALWIESESAATSEFLNVPTSGKSTLEGLTIDGQQVIVTGEVNQTIPLSDGYLVINEQSASSSRQSGTLTVNALHLVDGAGSIIAASATAQVINTPTPNPGP
jgi:hypothetical protein